MPPSATGPLALAHYLTQLLTAMCIERGGELRIPMKAIRSVREESSRQMLVEDTNTETDELVLRFGTKHSAVYPLEPECHSPKTSPQTLVSPPISIPSSPQSRPPLSDEQLRQMEIAVRTARVKARAERTAEQAREQRQNDLSEILDRNS